MKKRVLSMFMALVLCLTLLPTAALATENETSAQSAEEALLSTEGAEGTAENPILIGSLDELEAFRYRVNEYKERTLCAQLTADITLGDSWTSIGNNQSYIGTFDGNGHTIYAEKGVANLFGRLGTNGKVQGLTVEIDTMTASSGSAVLVGENSGGTIERCSVRIYGMLTISSYFSLIAYTNTGTIEHCRSSVGKFSASGSAKAAGIAYTNYGTIKSCYFNGKFRYDKTTGAQDYAITSSLRVGTVENCYCKNDVLYRKENWYLDESRSGVHGAALRPDDRFNYKYTLENGQVTWLLNNGEGTSTNYTEPWRLDEQGVGGTPTLDPADGRVTKSSDTYTWESLHTHTVGGRLHEFEALSSTPGSSGYYYLDANTTLSGTWNITGETVLCLNGNTLTTSGNVITVAAGGTLTLMTHDKKTPGGAVTGEGTIVALQGGTLVMQGGTISGGTTGVELPTDSTFRMEGGEITGCAAGVSVEGGNLTLSGSAKVEHNTQNILLEVDSVLSFGNLNASAKFGISVEGQDAMQDGDRVAVTDTTGARYFAQLVADGFKNDGLGFELYLSDDGKTVMLGKQSVHTHCICGNSSKNVNGHTHDADITFQPWTETNKLPASGNYYLTRNVTLARDASLQGANVCLNGYTVTLSNVGRINPSGTAQLTDCSVDGKGKLESYAGKANGGVTISGGNKFCLYGGTLNGVKVEIGQTGGGTFNMYGGKITGNTKGTVVGQSKTSKNTTITINMYGGEISGNHISESQGGGVFVGSGNQFNMYGGTIQNNSAVDGGGVYIAPAYNAYSAGEMTICGDAVIQGNKAGSVTNNVSLPSGKQITISGKLVENAKIGVTTRANLSQGNVNIATATDTGWVAAKNFTSDNSAYHVGLANDGKTVQLQVHSHQWKYTASGATITAACKAPSCPAPAGGSVTINKPAHTTYGDGQSEKATLTENSWQGLAVNEDAITYTKGGTPLGAAPTDAGTYTASITLGEGNKAATASVKYTIAKAEPTAEDFNITEPGEHIYDGQPVSVTKPTFKGDIGKTGMGEVTVKYAAKDSSETAVETAPTAAGTYTVTFDVAEGTNYSAATGLKIGELTISNGTLAEGKNKEDTICYSDTGVKTYTHTDFGFSGAGTFALNGSVTEGTNLLATGYPKFENNGVQVQLVDNLTWEENTGKKVVIPMTFTPNGGNYKPKEVTLTITLADKATDTKTMTVTQKDFVYGEETVNPQITGVEGTPTFTYKSDKAGAAESSEKPTDAGKYTVTAVLNTADTIYTASADFEIMAKSISGATVDAITGLAYNGTAHTPTPAVKMGSTALANATDYTLSYSENTNAGTATMTVTGRGNYTGTETVNFDIGQATLTVTPTGGQSKKFGATDPTLTYTTSGVVGSQIPSFTGKLSRAEGEDVGQYDITLGTLAMMNHDSSGFKASNYTLKMVSPAVKFEITKGTYTGSTPTKTVNILKNYAGVQTGTLTAADFFTTAPAEAKITNAVPKADFRNMMSIAGADPSGNFTYDSKTNITAASDASWTITISSKNYTDITATLTFSPVDRTNAGVTISGVPTSKIYGESFTLTASVTDAGTGTGSWTWTSNDPSVLQVTGIGASATVKALKAGSATISAKYESDTTMGEQTTAPITVGKRVITVTADNKSMTVNGTLPTFTVTYGNLPSGVQAADIFGTLASASTTTDGKTTGSFDITVTTPVLKTEAGANYEVGAVTKGTLTVNPRPSSGGGGGSSVSTYSVTVGKTENGSVSISPKSASKGSTVTITVTPDKGYVLETLTVLDKNDKEIKLTEKNGKYTFTMPAGKVEVKVTFMDDNTMLNYFVDVKAGDYFYDAVKWAAEKGITSGTDATHFSPNAACTRAQIVTFLWRAAGSPEPKGTGSFADVPSDSYYTKAVAWAVENGITGGTGDGKFSPNATCTREQAVAFLYRASGSPAVSGGSAFNDVAANAYYADAVAWAEKNEITGGIGGGLFGSGNDCTRAQIVTFLYRTYQGK